MDVVHREARAMYRKLLVLATAAAALCHAAMAQPAATSSGANTDLSKKNGDLSDKLNKSNGVIHPDDAVDPKMQRPAPATGEMPVIPPPGAPGGAPGVQPK
jgi:hypothetical protein